MEERPAAAGGGSGSDLTPLERGDGRKTPWLLVAAVVGFLVLALGAGILFTQGGDDESTQTQGAEDTTVASSAESPDASSAVTQAVTPDTATASSTAEDTEDNTASTVAEVEAVPATPPVSDNPDVVSLAVPMRDIFGVNPDASGVLSFDINKVTGEVCYAVTADGVSEPFNTHIHAESFGVKGGVVVDMGEHRNGDVGCVENLPVDTAAILANPVGHYAELHDAGGEWTVRGQLVETVDAPGIVPVSVPMRDIFDVAPDASGTLDFDFNTITGEVCYAVTASNIDAPFNTHIHAGEDGVKGGVVVDMGPHQNGGSGCVENLPNDTRDILANPGGHYAELHDPSGDWTIRGQLSIADDSGEDREGGVVDTQGGGAFIEVRDGTVTLTGAVPDQETADTLVASLEGIDEDMVTVVNDLTVEAGAALPSGRVVIADAIFFDSGSDEVKDISQSTLDSIVALAQSRPDWVVTVVGHTDSLGEEASNLELSLRRAGAIRDLLASQGVAEDSLRTRGAGETAPIGDNGTDAGRAENRRIEFEFTPQ